MNTAIGRDGGRRRTRIRAIFRTAGAAMTLAILGAGCDGGHDDEVYVTDDCEACARTAELRSYVVDVRARTSWNAAIAGAAVRLIVSHVPEEIAYGSTDASGTARFYVQTWPGVALTAEVDGGSMGYDFITGYADATADHIVLEVVLPP